MTAPPGDIRPQLDLAFARRGERTVLTRRLFRWPFVLTRTFALDPVPGHMLTIMVQTGSGAVHGGDRLAQRFDVGAGAAAHITTPGASVVHRAAAAQVATERVDIRVANGGLLEYMPEPRILFPDAALDQRIEIDCADGGVALVADAFTVHDPEALGRGFRRLAATTILRCGGPEPVLVDRMDIGDLGRGQVTRRYTAFGSVLLAVPGHTLGLEELADALSATFATIPHLYGAATLLPGGPAGIGVRLAGPDLRVVRAGLQATWAASRRFLYGTVPSPRRKGD